MHPNNPAGWKEYNLNARNGIFQMDLHHQEGARHCEHAQGKDQITQCV